MARVPNIPQIEASQGLDTQRSTQPNIQIDMSPYRAMQELGDTLAQVGFKWADRQAAKEKEMQTYKAERSFQEFQNNVLMDQTDYEQNADPSGEGYLKGYQPRFQEHQSTFEQTIPENLRLQYAPKIENFKGQVNLSLARKEVDLRNGYYESTLNNDVEGLASTLTTKPELSDQAWSTINSNLELSGLSKTKKAELLQTYRKKINEATVQGYVSNGEFDKARDYIKHLGPAPPVIPHDKTTSTDPGGVGKVVVYSHVDYERVHPEVKAAINSTSAQLGISLNVTSGYRSLTHPVEARKGARAMHRHTTGTAVDLDVKNYDQKTRSEIIKQLVARGATGLGTYKNSPNMIHVDWSGLGAGVKEKGISTWYSGESSDVNAPQWFKDAYREGLALRKRGGVSFNTKTTVDSSVRPIEEGNINLHDRPMVKNKDGSISTVRSMSFEQDGQEILVPTVSEDGRIMSDKEAIRQYQKTGKHLGKFKSAADADAYAQSLHVQQDQEYVDVVPNKVTAGDWTLKNYDPWEFGSDVNVDAPVAAAFDLMTGALGRKIPFKAGEDNIKLNMDGTTEEQRIGIVRAAQSSGFNRFDVTTENGKTYMTMKIGKTKSDSSSAPEWMPKDLPQPEKNYSEIAGPNAKFVPRGAPDADKLNDYIDRQEEHANTEHEKAVKAAQNEVSKEGWSLVRGGKLDDEWLDKNIDNLSETDYRMLSKQLLQDRKAKKEGKENKPYEHDQTMYVQLIGRAVNPKDEEVIRDAIDAQSKNLISKADFNKIYDMHQKTITDGALGKPSDWKPIIRKYVIDKIIKNPDDPEDTKYLDDRLNAVMELDDFMKEHPDADRNKVAAEAQNIIKKYNGASNQDKRASLPMTALPGVGRYEKITPQMLKTAAQKVQADFKAGIETQATRDAKMKELSDWFNVINDESKNGQ